MWIDYKTENEVNPVKLRPHPHEFHLYYELLGRFARGGSGVKTLTGDAAG
jgi:hypothetical protein